RPAAPEHERAGQQRAEPAGRARGRLPGLPERPPARRRRDGHRAAGGRLRLRSDPARGARALRPDAERPDRGRRGRERPRLRLVLPLPGGAERRLRPHRSPLARGGRSAMTRARALLGALAAAATAAVLLLGGALVGSSSADGSAGRHAAAAGAPERALTGLSAAGDGSAAQVRGLEASVRADPSDARALTLLGLAYGQRWRETGDPSYVSLQARALARARALRPDDPLLLQGLGSLALTRHEFRRALALGRRAARLAPFTANVYGIV